MKYVFNLLCYGLFKIPKTTIFFVLLNIKIDYFLELSFKKFLKIPYNIFKNEIGI